MLLVHSRGCVGRVRRTLAALLLLAATAAPTTAWADEDSTATAGVLGLGAGVASLVYTPIKIVWATTGTAVTGLTWLFSAGDGWAAGRVARTSLRGDYVVTPHHLRGEREIHFLGR